MTSLDVENLAFINLCHGIDNTRLYRMDKVLYCYTVDRYAIKPFETKCAREMAQHLFNVLECCIGEVNLNFGYPKGMLGKKQKKKLKHLLNDDNQDITENRLVQWVMLLWVGC